MRTETLQQSDYAMMSSVAADEERSHVQVRALTFDMVQHKRKN